MQYNFGVHTETLDVTGSCDLQQSHVLRLAVCWSFTSWQRLMSYQDKFRLETECTRGYSLVDVQAGSTMILYPTQSPYPDTEPTSPCAILKMSSISLGTGKYTFLSHWFNSTRVRTCEIRIPRYLKALYSCPYVCSLHTYVCMCICVYMYVST